MPGLSDVDTLAFAILPSAQSNAHAPAAAAIARWRSRSRARDDALRRRYNMTAGLELKLMAFHEDEPIGRWLRGLGDVGGAIEAGAIEAGAVEAGAVEGGAVEGGATEGGAMKGGAVEWRKELTPSDLNRLDAFRVSTQGLNPTRPTPQYPPLPPPYFTPPPSTPHHPPPPFRPALHQVYTSTVPTCSSASPDAVRGHCSPRRRCRRSSNGQSSRWRRRWVRAAREASRRAIRGAPRSLSPSHPCPPLSPALTHLHPHTPLHPHPTLHPPPSPYRHPPPSPHPPQGTPATRSDAEDALLLGRWALKRALRCGMEVTSHSPAFLTCSSPPTPPHPSPLLSLCISTFSF